ncbi:hypothetical protein ACWEVO_03565, partial [Micromonospora sp. NPDC003776]
ALIATGEAVELYRELVRLNRDAHLSGLASSLRSHTVPLAQAGRLAEALIATGEAVELYRELVRLNRDAHLSGLASSLWNVGWITVQVPDPDYMPTAIKTTTEAIGIYTELAAAEPDAFARLRDAATETLDQLTAQQ